MSTLNSDNISWPWLDTVCLVDTATVQHKVHYDNTDYVIQLPSNLDKGVVYIAIALYSCMEDQVFLPESQSNTNDTLFNHAEHWCPWNLITTLSLPLYIAVRVTEYL